MLEWLDQWSLQKYASVWWEYLYILIYQFYTLITEMKRLQKCFSSLSFFNFFQNCRKLEHFSICWCQSSKSSIYNLHIFIITSLHTDDNNMPSVSQKYKENGKLSKCYSWEDMIISPHNIQNGNDKLSHPPEDKIVSEVSNILIRFTHCAKWILSIFHFFSWFFFSSQF